MKKTLSTILISMFVSLSAFVKVSTNHEQIAFDSYEQVAFDYFVSDILESDFKDVTTIDFKGKTEDSFSTLGKYKFCLRPEEKLGAIMKNAAQGRSYVREVRYSHSKGLTIFDSHGKATGSRVLVYPSLHVADNYYVFLSLQKPNEAQVRYVVELNPGGNISRSCRMD